ncbi:MAG TPA: response regulator [bacterium]|nr:response regulator [bacterium]
MPEDTRPEDVLLCVDDEKYVLSSLERAFRNQPLRLVTALSGAEALKIMEREPVRVLITDQRMPGMTGTELLGRVKERWPHVVRIILSGFSEVADLIQAINEGEVYRFIKKPWDNAVLRDLVGRAMEQSRVMDEMGALKQFLGESGHPDNLVNFRVGYAGNTIKMELTETKHPLSAEQIVECLHKIFNTRRDGKELDAIGGALVKQNGKLTFMTEFGNNLQLVLEFPISKSGGLYEG